MAWRHRSSREKVQLGAIGFLCFALFCFIIAVVAMDLSFKAKIRDLEDELDAYKTTPNGMFTTTDFTNTDASTNTDDSTTDTTTTKPTTTTTTITTTKPTTTTTTTPITTSTSSMTTSQSSESI